MYIFFYTCNSYIGSLFLSFTNSTENDRFHGVCTVSKNVLNAVMHVHQKKIRSLKTFIFIV